MPPKSKEQQSQEIMKENFMDKTAIKRAKETFEELDKELDRICQEKPSPNRAMGGRNN